MNTKLVLNNYILEISSIEEYNFDSLLDNLDSKIYPRQIIETLETINCIRKISIYDKNNKHIITSSIEIFAEGQ